VSNRPLLFLLEPSFPDPGVGSGLFFCPHCATVEGILAYYPAVRERLDVRHVAFQRPRAAVIEVLGPEHRACQATARTDHAAAVAAPAAASKGARTWRRYPRSSATSSMPPGQSAKP